MRKRHPAMRLSAPVVARLSGSGAAAQSIIDDWTSVKAPPPPALVPVMLDPKSTVLLLPQTVLTRSVMIGS